MTTIEVGVKTSPFDSVPCTGYSLIPKSGPSFEVSGTRIGCHDGK